MSSTSSQDNNSLFQQFEEQINDDSYYQKAIEKLHKEIAPEIQQYLIKIHQHQILKLNEMKQMHIKNQSPDHKIIKVEQNIERNKQLLAKIQEKFSVNEWLRNGYDNNKNNKSQIQNE